jgi:hypothetical protein
MTKSKKPDHNICVIKRAELESATTGEAIDHMGPNAVNDPLYKLQPITLEAGATLVSAALWTAHKDNPNLRALDRFLTVYDSAEEAFSKMSQGQLLKVVKVSRHGALLRRWHELEQASSKPRMAVIKALVERLRLYGDFAPIQFDARDAMPKLAASGA